MSSFSRRNPFCCLSLSLSLHARGGPFCSRFSLSYGVGGVVSWFTSSWVVSSEIKKGENKPESWRIGLQGIKPPTWGNVCSQSGINSLLFCPLQLNKPKSTWLNMQTVCRQSENKALLTNWGRCLRSSTAQNRSATAERTWMCLSTESKFSFHFRPWF